MTEIHCQEITLFSLPGKEQQIKESQQSWKLPRWISNHKPANFIYFYALLAKLLTNVKPVLARYDINIHVSGKFPPSASVFLKTYIVSSSSCVCVTDIEAQEANSRAGSAQCVLGCRVGCEVDASVTGCVYRINVWLHGGSHEVIAAYLFPCCTSNNLHAEGWSAHRGTVVWPDEAVRSGIEDLPSSS